NPLLYKSVSELFPFWIVSVSYLFAIVYLKEWGLNITPVVAIFWLLLSLLEGLKVGQIASALTFSLILVEIYISIIFSNSLHFSHQPLFGKVAIIELFTTLWLLQVFVEKHHKDSLLYPIFYKFRTIFYLIIPIVPFYFAFKQEYSFTLLIYWLIPVLYYAIFKLTKRDALKIALYISIILQIVTLDIVKIGVRNHFMLWSLGHFIGVLILSILLYFNRKNRVFIEIYLYFITLSSLFFVFNGRYSDENILFSYIVPLLTLIIWMFFKFNRFWFWIKTALLFLIITQFSLKYTSFSVTIPIFIIFIASFYFLIKKEKKIGFWYKVEHLYINILFISFYSFSLLELMNDQSSILITLMLILHSIALLFISIGKNLQFLSKFSFILFLIVVYKILVYDLETRSFIEKITVFMISGLILLFSAYMFHKWRKRI
ncbi:hypothetical protein JXR93_03935, partial [bacterium]|nr:hypothetical protein [bacterium]